MATFMHSSRVLCALLLVSATTLHAQRPPDPSGRWEGTIQTPQTAIAVEVNLARNSKGELAGSIDVPPQSLRGFPLVIEGASGQSLTFRFRGSLGNRVFQGTLSEDGKAMSGDFIQSGYSMPFALTRTGDARIDAPIRNPPLRKELEGPWSAALNTTYSNGIPQRIVLNLVNEPDGTATGSIINSGDGLEIPIGAITMKGSTLTLDLKAVGGSFSGTVNADGTELVGSFEQRGVALPLTFRRSPPGDTGN